MPLCNYCGRPLSSIGELGSNDHQYHCDNYDCLSNYEDVTCPRCNATVSKVETLGIGDHLFTCKRGHQFEI